MSSQRVPGGVVHKLPADLREALIASTTALDVCWPGCKHRDRTDTS